MKLWNSGRFCGVQIGRCLSSATYSVSFHRVLHLLDLVCLCAYIQATEVAREVPTPTRIKFLIVHKLHRGDPFPRHDLQQQPPPPRRYGDMVAPHRFDRLPSRPKLHKHAMQVSTQIYKTWNSNSATHHTIQVCRSFVSYIRQH